MRGMGRVYLRNRVWWIAFYHRGQKIRESSKSAKESVACALLKQRLAETQTGQFVADQGKVTFDDLVEGIVTDYALNKRRSFKSGAAVCITRGNSTRCGAGHYFQSPGNLPAKTARAKGERVEHQQ
jgi:hypothetical protein